MQNNYDGEDKGDQLLPPETHSSMDSTILIQVGGRYNALFKEFDLKSQG